MRQLLIAVTLICVSTVVLCDFLWGIYPREILSGWVLAIASTGISYFPKAASLRATSTNHCILMGFGSSLIRCFILLCAITAAASLEDFHYPSLIIATMDAYLVMLALEIGNLYLVQGKKTTQ